MVSRNACLSFSYCVMHVCCMTQPMPFHNLLLPSSESYDNRGKSAAQQQSILIGANTSSKILPFISIHCHCCHAIMPHSPHWVQFNCLFSVVLSVISVQKYPPRPPPLSWPAPASPATLVTHAIEDLLHLVDCCVTCLQTASSLLCAVDFLLFPSLTLFNRIVALLTIPLRKIQSSDPWPQPPPAFIPPSHVERAATLLNVSITPPLIIPFSFETHFH